MQYIFVTLFLVLTILAYFRIADRYNIIDRPNERSSHKITTILGGGILFPIAAILWFVVSGFNYPFMMTGLILLAFVSFIDDIRPLSRIFRFAVQMVAVTLLFYQLNTFNSVNPAITLLLYILVIGFANAVNFMDGINGITALYAISALGTFLYLNQSLHFTNHDLLIYLLLGILVFLYFNFRLKARCFAGDVGSISIAFLLAFFMIQLLQATKQWNYILFFALYGVDTVLTILHRILNKENIFEAHRTHLFQYLANEMKMGHRKVSLLYFVLQLVINFIIIFWVNLQKDHSILPIVVILLILSIIYMITKAKVLQHINGLEKESLMN